MKLLTYPGTYYEQCFAFKMTKISLGERVFMPNLICWSSEEDDEIFHSDSIEDFLQALEDLTEVEGDERPCTVITLFHNMRGFDGNFIFEALYKQGGAV